MGSLRFSGHDSFQCRNLWLRKGYDFIENSSYDFKDDSAVAELGVGKNMVSSIRFWLKAFHITDNDDNITDLANYLFGKNGKDPFLEDLGTLWLLHYHLIKEGEASIYSLVFNEFRKQRIEFTKTHLKDFLLNKCDELNENHSPNSIETDIGVLLKNYVKPASIDGRKGIEDLYSSLLIELDLIRKFDNSGMGKEQWYRIESESRDSLPLEVFFYSIIENYEDNRSISLHKLANDENSPGLVFALHPDALVQKVKQVANAFDEVVYKEDAGIRELQINRDYSKEEILNTYYGRIK